ncbi:YceD family protein [Erythrobacter crassostreae]|uniref:YceD family protein n=1 Tax=Erythrobacter crassostreae TaxID=2828328 RepID=UPI0034E2E4C8
MTEPELSRLMKVRPLPGGTVTIKADETERRRLAGRFSLTSIEALRAEIELEEKGKTIRATGTVKASFTQACAISFKDFPVTISEPLDLRFVPKGTLAEQHDEEIELEADDCDEIEYSGDTFDLGEAVAQTLGLAIDPYAEGPNADAARKTAGIAEEGQQDGPLAEALAALKKG